MQYLLTWNIRPTGSPEGNLAAAKRLQDVFGTWEEPSGGKFQHLAGLDGQHGYTLIETDDPRVVARATSHFSPFLDWSVDPLMSIEDAVAIGAETIAAHS